MNEKNKLVCYNTDGSRLIGRASIVVFPRSVSEVQDAVTGAEDVVPRGAGENIVGACIPNNSVVIDMKKMNNIKFDARTETVYVDAGVTVKELNEKLRAVGFEFPVVDEGTIGGIVAMNSIGFFGGYGRIKDWIDEIEFVNGRGEVIKIRKVDLRDVCGMEGITGVITKIKLKLIPLINKSASIFQTEEIEGVFIFSRRLKLENEVVMLRLYSPHVSKLLGFPEKYNLIIGFSSDKGKIKGNDYRDLLKKIRKDHYYLRSNGYYSSEDPEFFYEKLNEFVVFLEELNVPYFGDLTSRIIYPFFNDKGHNREQVVKMIKRMNGKPGNYGIGSKRKYLLDHLQKKIIQRIKLRHDPFWKMNKGKVIDFIDKERIEEMSKKEDEKMLPEKEIQRFIGSIEENETKERVKDYEDTFQSEFGLEKIENFVKEIPREINRKKDEENVDSFLDKKGEEASSISEDIEEKASSFMDKNEEIGNVSLSDNFDRRVRGKVSEIDEDLINKIMLNKSGDDEEEKNESRDS